MPHLALEIPELLSEILKYCSKNTLTKAARVSLLWMDLALNELWESLDTLDPLLKLLAPFEWILSNVRLSVTFSRALVPEDWVRLTTVYGHRIHRLRLSLPQPSYDCIWDDLNRTRPDTPILPRLTFLEWNFSISGLPLLLGSPSLHTLRLTYGHSESDYPALLSSLQYFLASGHCTALRELVCCEKGVDHSLFPPEIQEHDAQVQSSLVSLIQSSPAISIISLPSRYLSTRPIIDALSNLGSLLELKASASEEVAFEVADNGLSANLRAGQAFPSLRCVEIEGQQRNLWQLVIPAFSHCVVRRWTLSLGPRRVLPKALNGFLQTVANCGDPVSNLKTIKITAGLRDECITLGTLDPVLSWKNLEGLAIDVHGLVGSFGSRGSRLFDLDDQDMLCLAQSLPQLRYLKLWSKPALPHIKEPQGPTFLSLVHLANHCQQIERIAFHWDASATSPTQLPAVKHRFNCLTTLAMTHLNINVPTLVATFLHEICVNRVDTTTSEWAPQSHGCLNAEQSNIKWREMDACYGLMYAREASEPDMEAGVLECRKPGWEHIGS